MSNMSEYVEIPNGIEEDSKLEQMSEYAENMSDEAWKTWLEAMKVRRSARKKMKEVEKQLEADSEQELDELIEGAEKKLSK